MKDISVLFGCGCLVHLLGIGILVTVRSYLRSFLGAVDGEEYLDRTGHRTRMVLNLSVCLQKSKMFHKHSETGCCKHPLIGWTQVSRPTLPVLSSSGYFRATQNLLRRSLGSQTPGLIMESRRQTPLHTESARKHVTNHCNGWLGAFAHIQLGSLPLGISRVPATAPIRRPCLSLCWSASAIRSACGWTLITYRQAWRDHMSQFLPGLARWSFIVSSPRRFWKDDITGWKGIVNACVSCRCIVDQEFQSCNPDPNIHVTTVPVTDDARIRPVQRRTTLTCSLPPPPSSRSTSRAHTSQPHYPI